jgi:hypothetical protein
VAVDGAGDVYIADDYHNAVKEYDPATHTVSTLVSTGLNVPDGVAVDGAGDVYIADTYNNAVKEYDPATNTVSTLVSSGLNLPGGVAADAAGDVYIADTYNNTVKELARAYVDTTALDEPVGAGSDALPVVVSASATLSGVLAPTSDQTWLTIGSVANGVVEFSFTANTGTARTAHVSLLGQSIAVTQAGAVAPTLGAATASGVTDTAATLGGSATADGGSAIITRGILYAPTAADATPTIGGTGVIEVDDASGGTGSFAESVTGLTAGTGYTVVAFATNGVGTTYSDPVAFTTASPPPAPVSPPPAPVSPPAPTAPAPTAATTVSGTVFRDYNADGIRDGADAGLAGRTVFVDLNGDGTLDAGDPTAVTDASGAYTLTGVPAGTYTIRVVLTTLDQLAGSTLAVSTSGTPLTGRDIGLRPNSSVLPVAVSPDLFTNPPAATPAATYAAGLYEAVLGRAASAAEVAAAAGWTAAQTPAVRQQEALAFLGSDEYLGQLVERDYATFLGRSSGASDAAGVATFVAQLKGGVSANQVAVEFLTSAEFNQDHADNTGFVQTLFRDVLGRAGTDAEVANYLRLLQGGTSRAAVAAGFVNSPENAQDTVTALFAQYLQRAPDAGGETGYVAQLLSGANTSLIAAEILASGEFATRLGAGV